MSLFVEESLDHYKQDNSKEESVLEVIKTNKAKMIPFRFDCGKNDELIEYNRELHQELLKENISHIYEEFSGKHEWEYWENHVKDSLLFFDNL